MRPEEVDQKLIEIVVASKNLTMLQVLAALGLKIDSEVLLVSDTKMQNYIEFVTKFDNYCPFERWTVNNAYSNSTFPKALDVISRHPDNASKSDALFNFLWS